MRKPQDRASVRSALKNHLIRQAGGKCYKCGYNKCKANLTFHHVTPNLKLGTISQYISGVRAQRAKAEAKKCVLLCQNCHTEYHQGVYELYPYEICFGVKP